jgi:hypothetical protein
MDESKDRARTKRTIVGGRPPGRSRIYGAIPRGIEVLVKKASVDRAFRQVLLERRAEAAREIGLELTAAERAMLDAIPQAQLEATIEHIKVPDPQRRAFLGQIAAAMLAALASGCQPPTRQVEGIRPDSEDNALSTPEATSTPDWIIREVEVTKIVGHTVDVKDIYTLSPTATSEATPTPRVIEKGIRPDPPQ